MTQDQNYYVIVGRDGNRPVTRWSPAKTDTPTARSGDHLHCCTKPAPFAELELGRNELIDDTPS
jgi:hypothetical protein